MEQEEIRTGPTLNGWLMRLSRHRRSLLVCFFGGWLLVVSAAWILPARYRSETLILVEQQKVPEHYVEPNIALDLQHRLQSMSEQILSRTRLMSIVEKFHLYGADRSHSEIESIVEQMRKDINIDLVRASTDQITAFRVSYSGDSPGIAQQVTAELTSLFIEENLHNRQQMAEDTTSFLQNQLDDARKNLEAQEMRLREFKSRYLGQLPEQTSSNVQILSGLQNRLQSANDALNQSEQQKLYLQSLVTQYRALRPVGGAGLGNTDQNLAASGSIEKLKQMKSQLADLKAKYTSRHPDVVRLEGEIAASEKAASSEPQTQTGKSGRSDSSGGETSADIQFTAPILQTVSQLKAVEFDITNRKAEMKGIEREIDSYQQKLNLAPAREQELAAITRDHEQSRAYYESLLAKKNQSEMATNLEKRQQGEQFRMIDPPSLPQRPYFPNTLLFSLGGVALGLTVGLALVFIREFSNPKIYGEEELAVIVESPMILIPSILTPREERSQARARVFDAAIAATIALVIPAATLVLYYKV